jgi:anthranilate/para-aminobenzoate synthase component I
MLASVTVDALPDAFAIARALSDAEALVVARADEGRTTYVAVDPCEVSRELDPEPRLVPTDPAHGEIPRWFGLLPYEARRELERPGARDERAEPDLTLPLWRRYPAVVKIARGVEVLAEEPRVAHELAERLLRGLRRGPAHAVAPRVTLRERPEPGQAHAERIAQALELIRAGEIYQVNLARRFELAVEGPAFELLQLLAGGPLPPHALAVDWPELGVAMASPELFLRQEAGTRVWTRPIKGTRPRAADPRADAELADALEHDPKERAELAMVIDVERNDLGRLAVPGSVRLSQAPAVETHARVHHRAATVEATLRSGVTRRELLLAMLPSGSVTGAPKVRAMEIIAALEPARRGLYTGAAGYLRHDGGLELGMAIRTLTFVGGAGAFYAGGGIVADSDPEREVRETLWKAAALIELTGRPAADWA